MGLRLGTMVRVEVRRRGQVGVMIHYHGSVRVAGLGTMSRPVAGIKDRGSG